MFGSNKFEERLLAIERLLNERHAQEIARHKSAEEELRILHQRTLAEMSQFALNKMEERFGISADEMVSEVEILDFEGTARLTRRCRGFRVRLKEISIQSVLHGVGVTHPLASWEIEPRLVDCSGKKDFNLVMRPGGNLTRSLFDI
jgi:hypothetical protein